ncbi:MAG: hypothetical protein QMC89_02625 [Candidatus Hodarchaeaceae archaeon]|nr:hypothetical protein [Candidatus Hodarchaeaceae archaeon]
MFGSEQDLRDADGIHKQLGKLDMGYLEEACKEMGVQDEFAELKRRAKV